MIFHPRTLSSAAIVFALCSSSVYAGVGAHHRTTSHAMVRRTAAFHSSHVSHFAEHAATVSISPERATQIQSALVEKGYLSGEPSGTWDSASIAAMQKMQSDNGWQTKLVPDSRALIKLGLGPGSSPSVTATPGAPASASFSAGQEGAVAGQTY